MLPVSTQIEIAPQHHQFMSGRGGLNVKQIMQGTGSTIHFPDPTCNNAQRKSTVFISGPVDSVIIARHLLMVSYKERRYFQTARRYIDHVVLLF